MSAAAVVGIAAYAAALTGAAVLLLRRAHTEAVLVPVAVGLGLRLAVMVTAHVASVVHGDHGFFFLDDRGYDEIGRRLADAWRAGRLPDITSVQYAGSYAFGFEGFVGAIYFVAGPHVVAIKLANVLLGTAAVLLAARVASLLFGDTAGRRTAWLVALSPTLVWWSATMLKEAIAAFLLLAVLLEVLQLWQPRALILALAAMAALGITRITAAIAVAIAVVVGLGVAAIRMRRAVSWPALAFAAGAAIVAVGLGVAALSRGNMASIVNQYAHTAGSVTRVYGTGHPLFVPVDLLKTLVAPYPWVFGRASWTWYRALYPGMWVWYVLLPLAAVGIWRLRRQLDALLVVLPIGVVLVIDAFLLGFAFRQRSTVEPVILTLVAVGFTSWHQFARLGALSLFLAAVFATVQSGSVVVGALIAAVAAMLAWLAVALPSRSQAVCVGRPSRLEEIVVALRPPTRREHLHAAVPGNVSKPRRVRRTRSHL
jgi:hypothetical protein